MYNSDFDYIFKLIILGNTSVGKSSLLLRFCDQSFSDQSYPTIGVDFKIANINANGKQIKINIWDTAGQERFKTIVKSYYKGVQGCLLVYDVTDKESFKSLDYWQEQVRKTGGDKIQIMVVGNKSDQQDREVSSEEGRRWAESVGAIYIETSAKSGKNVDKAFSELAERLIGSKQQNDQEMFSNKNRIGLGTGQGIRKKEKQMSCC